MPRVTSCPTCLASLLVLRACVPSCLPFLRVFIFYVPYVPHFFTCLMCLQFLRALRVFIFSRVSESGRIWQTNSQLYIYVSLLPSEVSLQLKTLLKNIYNKKYREGEINTDFSSPSLLTSNALVQFKKPMLVYEEYFNTGVSIYISYVTICTFAKCSPPIW